MQQGEGGEDQIKKDIYVLLPKQASQTARELLSEWRLLESKPFLRGGEGLETDRVGIPIRAPLPPDYDVVQKLKDSPPFNDKTQIDLLIRDARNSEPSRSIKNSFRDKIVEVMNDSWSLNLEEELPKRWEKHSDLLLLPEHCFKSEAFSKYMTEIIDILCSTLKVKRIARKSRICSDDFRSPRVEFLTAVGDEWAERVDNGIIYRWDITKSMFSMGNITEKLRISNFDCRNEVVVDLFAGIGYFAVPYLVKANAKHLHACEWNPRAIEALKINMKANKITSDRYTIHFGDNRKVCPENVADRINLGLIPSSELSWSTACRALNQDKGGILHIHGNVDSSGANTIKEALNSWGITTKGKISAILGDSWTCDVLHIENVKSYGPKIYHAVIDLKCLPNACSEL